jgi:hypothetical protein
VFLAAEVLLVVGGSIVLLRRRAPRSWRVVGAMILVTYLAFLVFALVMWTAGHHAA